MEIIGCLCEHQHLSFESYRLKFRWKISIHPNSYWPKWLCTISILSIYIYGVFISQVPIIIPYVVLIISIYLVIGPIIDNPQIEYLYALSFIFAGLIFYVPFVKFGMTPRFMSKYITERFRNLLYTLWFR